MRESDGVISVPHDVMISYATVDKTTADAVCAKLEERGIRCWIAPRDILAGMDYADTIVSAIDSAKMMVLIFSSHANASKFVKREAERAVHDGIPIIPFRIEDCEPSRSLQFFISAQHWLDALTPPLEQHILKLAESISVVLGIPIPSPTQETSPQPPGPLPNKPVARSLESQQASRQMSPDEMVEIMTGAATAAGSQPAEAQTIKSAGGFGPHDGPERGALTTKFCRHCGATLAADVRFCRKCGTRLTGGK
ncbi:MAG TPA: TIR domain-containing protein [Candidatus Acidoferrales bacterium]|nr:TIR domain-containing protein [Candidatus Acidoferrales bacterium]